MIANLLKLEAGWVVVVAILAALLLGSHQVSQNNEFSLLGTYIYWLFRVLIQAGIFIAVFKAVERYVERYSVQWLPEAGVISVAMLLSLLPYVLTVTMLDLLVGLPEIGLNGDTAAGMSTAKAFAYELVYLLDNHLALCVMLLLPRFIFNQASNAVQPAPPARPDGAQEQTPALDNAPNVFVHSLEPPLQGELMSVEAQEHYVQVVSTDESRMVLYRFSDVVRQLPESMGMQVHRSHWVAHSAVKQVVLQGQTMKLELNDKRFVPVSRTFRNSVESRFGTA